MNFNANEKKMNLGATLQNFNTSSMNSQATTKEVKLPVYNLIHPGLFFRPMTNAQRGQVCQDFQSVNVASEMLETVLDKVGYHIWVSYLDEYRNDYIVARQFNQHSMIVNMSDIRSDQMRTVIDRDEADEPVSLNFNDDV